MTDFLCVPRRAPALAAIALLAACAEPEPAPPAPKPVRVQAVHNTEVATEEHFTGSVRARVETELAFRVGGKVVKRLVDPGTLVNAGDALAQLDVQDYAHGLAAARNQLEAARIDADQAAADELRFRQLLAEGAVASGDHERQKARADAARERAAQAQRQVELAANRVDYAVLRAPYAGVVTAVRLDVGQVVAEGQPVIGLAAHGERDIVVDIPEHRIADLRDAQATATLWAGRGKPFAVALRELAPMASPATRTYRARFRVSQEERDAPPLALGMTATVRLALPSAQPVALLPATVLHQRHGEPAVWVLNAAAGSVTLTPVQVVAYGQDEVRVAGLPQGALVVTAGTQKLDAQMQVVGVDAAGRPVAVLPVPRVAGAVR